MDQPAVDRLVNQRFLVLSVICSALVASVAIYVGIAWLLNQQGSLPTGDPTTLPPVLPMALAAFAVLVLLCAPVVARAVLGQVTRSQSDSDPTSRLNGYQTSTIVGMALRESASIIGLVLTFLTGNLNWVIGLSLVSAAAMLIAWPKKERMREIARCGPTALG